MVGERQLRAGVRTLAPDDQPGPLRPAGQIDHVGDLTDLAVVARRGVLVKRWDPGVLRDLEDRGADLLGQLVADGEPHVPLAAVVHEPVRRAGGIGAHQNLEALDVLGWDLRQRPVHDDLVVLCGVRTRVPRAQHAAERLPGLVQVGLHRVKPVAAPCSSRRPSPSPNAP
jgi:hypothetical protein